MSATKELTKKAQSDPQEFKKDLAILINGLQFYNQDDDCKTCQEDFLDIALSELIASDFFASMYPPRKKDLFNQSKTVYMLMDLLIKFLSKYDSIEASEMLNS